MCSVYMFSTFHYVTFEVKLLTTLEKVRTQVLQNTKLLQLLLEKVEVPDESSALEQLPVEVHFPTSNREELDKLEDQLDNADVLNRVVHVCTCHIFFNHKQLFLSKFRFS